MSCKATRVTTDSTAETVSGNDTVIGGGRACLVVGRVKGLASRMVA